MAFSWHFMALRYPDLLSIWKQERWMLSTSLEISTDDRIWAPKAFFVASNIL